MNDPMKAGTSAVRVRDKGFWHGLFSWARPAGLLVAGLGLGLPPTEAATLIDLDATQLAAGPLNTWTNTGTLAGDFTVPTGAMAPTVTNVDGVMGLWFTNVPGDGDLGSQYVGPVAPDSVCFTNARTVEAWVFNSTAERGEVVFAWGRQGEEGLNNAFGHGTNTTFGAVEMWGAPDLGWGTTAAQVATNTVFNRWTYIVQSFDGSTNRVYVDGRLANSKGPPDTSLINTTNLDFFGAPLPFRVARQTAYDGTASDTFRSINIIIGRIRVKNSAMDSGTISSQFNAEKNAFNLNDTDGDGMPDWWEARQGLDKNNPTDGVTDPDSDALNNLSEFQYGTNPTLPDSDGDGAGDGAEVNRLDPQTSLPAPTNPIKFDTDDDGLSDGAETDTGVFVSAGNTGSDPLKGDTDGDNWSDGFEVARDTDPNTIGPLPDPSLLPLVDLNATQLTEGFLNTWTNSGTLNGNFSVPTNATVPSVVTRDGVKGVAFLATGGPIGGTHYLGPEVPEFLTGAGTRSVEAWIHNPSPEDDEVIFAWGRFGGDAPDGKAFSLNHGQNNTWGALFTWGAGDLGWADQEVYDRWTHLVATYDGGTIRVYTDGQLVNSKTVVINTAAFAATAPGSTTDSTNRLRFRIARHNNDTGGPDAGPNGATGGAFTLARLKVFNLVLDPATVEVRFNSAKASFNLNDTDGDGMPDWYEARCGLDKNVDDAALDQDGDGLTNLQEFLLGTRADLADTDGDGSGDGAEVNRVDPATGLPAPTNPLDPDTDHDGLADGAETGTGVFIAANEAGSDPLNPDTDGDGYSDGVEASYCSDPNDAGQLPVFCDPVPCPPCGPVINLDSTRLPVGALSLWTNRGILGGNFVVPTNATVPVVVTVDGVRAVAFQTNGGAIGGAQFLGPEVPGVQFGPFFVYNLTSNGVRTVEAWIHDPASQSEKTIFAWGRQGGAAPDGRNFAVGHGTNSLSGAVNTGGTTDIGWANRAVFDRWTYLVVTYSLVALVDAQTNYYYTNVLSVFVDGQLVNSKTNVINTATFAADAPNSPTDSTNRLHFRLARQNDDTGGIDGTSWGTFHLARLRVLNHALEAPDILKRFNAEKQLFAAPLRLGIVRVDGSNHAVTLSWTSPPAQSLSLEFSANLLNWDTLATNLNGNVFTDYLTNSVSNQKFYRLKSP